MYFVLNYDCFMKRVGGVKPLKERMTWLIGIKVETISKRSQSGDDQCKTQTPSPSDTVVLVHGLAANRIVMRPLATRLAGHGYRTINWSYPSIRRDIERHASSLLSRLQQLDDDPSVAHVRLVTHSMGAIIARRALMQTRPDKLRSLVMLCPPNHGSRVATALARRVGWLCKSLSQLSAAADSFVNCLDAPRGIDVGIIAASHDRVVSIESTHLSTELDHCEVPSGHTTMLFRRDVADYVVAFLRQGRLQSPRLSISTTPETTQSNP